jgi:hypothetical protein
MKQKVYIETSVVSYLTSRPSRDVIIAGRQTITHDWWDNFRLRFDLFISELVEDEISQGDSDAAALRMQEISDIESLSSSVEAERLAELLLTKGAIPAGSEDDAAHIAIASAQGMDYLLTWNFKHINNAEKRVKIAAAVESCGFVCPQLCSPEELGEGANV